MSYINTVWIYILLLAVAAIVLAVGLYVYTDARSRGIKAGLWTMIAILTPCFIGLIMYVLVRDDERNLRCVACGYPVKADWKVCPVCETLLPKESRILSSPLNKDKGIWKVTAAAVLIPVLICFLMGAVIMPGINNHYIGGATRFDMTKDDVKNGELQKWFQECDQKDDDTRCFILSQSRDGKESGKEKETFYVIYIKGEDQLKFVDSQQENLILKTQNGKYGKGYVIIGAAHYMGTLNLTISIDGIEFQPEHTEADFNLEDIINDNLDS